MLYRLVENSLYLCHRFWPPRLHGTALAVPHAGREAVPAAAAARSVAATGGRCGREVGVLAPALLPHGLELVLVAGARPCNEKVQNRSSAQLASEEAVASNMNISASH